MPLAQWARSSLFVALKVGILRLAGAPRVRVLGSRVRVVHLLLEQTSSTVVLPLGDEFESIQLKSLQAAAASHSVSLVTEIASTFMRRDVATISLAYYQEKLRQASAAPTKDEKLRVLLRVLGRPEVDALTATARRPFKQPGLYMLDKDGTGSTAAKAGASRGSKIGKSRKSANKRREEQGSNGGSLGGVPVACTKAGKGPFTEVLFEAIEALVTLVVAGSIDCTPGSDMWGSPGDGGGGKGRAPGTGFPEEAIAAAAATKTARAIARDATVTQRRKRGRRQPLQICLKRRLRFTTSCF